MTSFKTLNLAGNAIISNLIRDIVIGLQLGIQASGARRQAVQVTGKRDLGVGLGMGFNSFAACPELDYGYCRMSLTMTLKTLNLAGNDVFRT